MEPNELYQDDAVGGVKLAPHAGGLNVSGLTGLTSNHAAWVLVAVGLIGLWAVARIFKGA